VKKKPRLLGVSAALLWVLLLCLLPGRASAANQVDQNRRASLALSYVYDSVVLPGVQVSIYQVAGMNKSGRYSLTSDFADTKVDVTGKTDWSKVAQTLRGGIALYSISATASASSNAQGQVSFTGLVPGLYLILANRITVDGYIYTFSPTLLPLPSLGADDRWAYDVSANPESNWVYDVTANTKPGRNPDGGSGGGGGASGGDGGQFVSYQVVKRWIDLGYETNRPKSVTIEILKNGVPYMTQILSDENNWTCSWTAPDDGSEWLVVERDIAKAYTVTVTEADGVFVVTDSYTEELEEEPIPEGPAPTEPAVPENSAAATKDGDMPAGTPADGKTPELPTGSLPQTGQLWWPVPLMSAGGLVLFTFGWSMRRKGGRGHEE